MFEIGIVAEHFEEALWAKVIPAIVDIIQVAIAIEVGGVAVAVIIR